MQRAKAGFAPAILDGGVSPRAVVAWTAAGLAAVLPNVTQISPFNSRGGLETSPQIVPDHNRHVPSLPHINFGLSVSNLPIGEEKLRGQDLKVANLPSPSLTAISSASSSISPKLKTFSRGTYARNLNKMRINEAVSTSKGLDASAMIGEEAKSGWSISEFSPEDKPFSMPEVRQPNIVVQSKSSPFVLDQEVHSSSAYAVSPVEEISDRADEELVQNVPLTISSSDPVSTLPPGYNLHNERRVSADTEISFNYAEAGSEVTYVEENGSKKFTETPILPDDGQRAGLKPLELDSKKSRRSNFSKESAIDATQRVGPTPAASGSAVTEYRMTTRGVEFSTIARAEGLTSHVSLLIIDDENILVKLADILKLIKPLMPIDEYIRLASSSSSTQFISLNDLRGAGIPARFLHNDELSLGR